MVCAMLEITQDVRADHAQYLAHWVALMKEDPKAILTAASKASQAVDYLLSLQPQPTPDPADEAQPTQTTDAERAPSATMPPSRGADARVRLRPNDEQGHPPAQSHSCRWL